MSQAQYQGRPLFQHLPTGRFWIYGGGFTSLAGRVNPEHAPPERGRALHVVVVYWRAGNTNRTECYTLNQLRYLEERSIPARSDRQVIQRTLF